MVRRHILGFSKKILHLYIFVPIAVQIGFNNMTYTGSEGDEVISVTVAILNGTLSQELVVLIGILTKEDTAKCMTVYYTCIYVSDLL